MNSLMAMFMATVAITNYCQQAGSGTSWTGPAKASLFS